MCHLVTKETWPAKFGCCLLLLICARVNTGMASLFRPFRVCSLLLSNRERTCDLSGGLSNLLLRVIDTYSGTTFVVRSAGTRGVDAINRLEEFLTHVFLAEHGLVPSRPYGRFANGFVTDFVPGHSLDVSDFRPQAPEIAKTIAKWHAAPLDPAVKIPHIFFHASLWLARGRSVCQVCCLHHSRSCYDSFPRIQRKLTGSTFSNAKLPSNRQYLMIGSKKTLSVEYWDA